MLKQMANNNCFRIYRDNIKYLKNLKESNLNFNKIERIILDLKGNVSIKID